MDKEKLDSVMDQIKQVYSLRDDREITPESELKEDLNTISMQYFAMMSIIKDEFGKNVSYSQVKACKTIQDVLDLGES